MSRRRRLSGAGPVALAVAVLAAVVVIAVGIPKTANPAVPKAGQAVGYNAGTAPAHTRALWVGDSYTQGAGVPATSSDYATLAMERFGWYWSVDAQGDTGYVNNGRSDVVNKNITSQAAIDRLPADRKQYPHADVIFLDLGRNDGSFPLPRIEQRAGKTFDAVAADWPHAEVVVIAPYYLTTKYPVAVELRDWEKQQATRRHWAFIDATAEGWATHQDNNLLSADRIHPSEAGQQFIADHLAADLHRDGVVKHATASEPRA